MSLRISSQGMAAKLPPAYQLPGRVRGQIQTVKKVTGYWRPAPIDINGVRFQGYRTFFGIGKLVQWDFRFGGEKVDTPKSLIDNHLDLNKNLDNARNRLSKSWYGWKKVALGSLLTGAAVTAPFGAKIAGMFLSMSSSLYTGLGICLAGATAIIFAFTQFGIRKLIAGLSIWKNKGALTANKDKIRELYPTQKEALAQEIHSLKKPDKTKGSILAIFKDDTQKHEELTERLAELKAPDLQETEAADVQTARVEEIATAGKDYLERILFADPEDAEEVEKLGDRKPILMPEGDKEFNAIKEALINRKADLTADDPMVPIINQIIVQMK